MVDHPNPPPRQCQLYLISPPEFQPDAFIPQLEAALTAAKRVVGAFLLRMETEDEDQIATVVRALQPICAAHKIAFIMDAHVDLATELEMDGVHLADTMAVQRARAVMDPSMVLGMECGTSQDDAMRVGEEGADYVVFDAFMESSDAAVGLENLEWWQHYFVLPCAAIGGITPENCAPLVLAGADFLIVGAAVWDHPAGPEAAVQSFDAAIREALQTA